MKHLELFSGIGGFRQALELISKDWGLKFDNIGFSEIEPNAVTSNFLLVGSLAKPLV